MDYTLEIPDLGPAAAAAMTHPPEIVFCRGPNFTEEQLRLNLNVFAFARDSFWNDTITSIIVISGTWRVFVDSEYRGAFKDLTPGYYADIGIPDGTLSSAKVIAF